MCRSCLYDRRLFTILARLARHANIVCRANAMS